MQNYMKPQGNAMQKNKNKKNPKHLYTMIPFYEA